MDAPSSSWLIESKVIRILGWIVVATGILCNSASCGGQSASHDNESRPIFDEKTNTIYIPPPVRGKFDWHHKDYRNWFVGGDTDFVQEGKEIVWHIRRDGGLGSWLAFDKNKDITWSADCRMSIPPDVNGECGIFFYHEEAYYARLLTVSSAQSGQVFLTGHHFRPDSKLRWAKPDSRKDWRNKWVNFRFEWKAKEKELRFYTNNRLVFVSSEWNVVDEPHPVMGIYNWSRNDQAEFYVKNIEISKGDLGCWSLSATRMSGNMGARQIIAENLAQEAPSDGPGWWFLTENALTGTLKTPFIELCPERSFGAIRIESNSSARNEENDLRLVILDEHDQPIADGDLPGNAEGFDVANGLWSKDLSGLAGKKALRFKLVFSRSSPKAATPGLFWLDVDTPTGIRGVGRTVRAGERREHSP
ncbi:MAG: hypothetical protein QME66_11105 [Candidatus Eisenbacteria bacterium]|nr:hypothetical protein [Candidatus Eisenbacteria bacterium]